MNWQRQILIMGLLAAAVMTGIYPPRLYFSPGGQRSTLEAVCGPVLDRDGPSDVVVEAYIQCIDGAPLNVPLWLAYMAGIALVTALLMYLTRPRPARA